MALNLAKAHGFVVNEVASTRTLRDSMDRIIAHCAEGRPHPDWDVLARLPYEDLEDLAAWIKKPFLEEPTMEKLAGLWFGIFNPVYSGETVADLYVCGSMRFDPSPHDNEWAVDPDWWPE